jgi:hypothetical protein
MHWNPFHPITCLSEQISAEPGLKISQFLREKSTRIDQVRNPRLNGGEGEIRTHVPELPDHPISSRRRYDHFGTSPVNLKFFSFT